MLDWFMAALIGIIQGITEWLPISSSGQTTIVMVGFLRISPELAISLGLAVHIGTALSVFARYPKQLLDLGKRTKSTRFYWTTTIVSLMAALPILLVLEQTFESELWTGLTITLFIGIALIITGLFLARAGKETYRPISDGDLIDRITLGLAQAVAVLPGISRSGMTVGTLLIRGFKKEQALVFSFLLSVPVSLASASYFLIFGSVASVGLWAFMIAIFFAFIFGYLTMNALVRIARDIDFSKFCVFFGSLAVVLTILLWLVS